MILRKQKVLFVTGSMNQTSQMHQVAAGLPEFDCWFSQIFSDNKLINFIIKYTSFANGTALTGQFRENSERYFKEHGLQVDYGAHLNQYDLVIYCTDILIPKRMRKNYIVWVQEGMIDKYTLKSRIAKKLGLPPFIIGDTSLNGSSNICDVYCAASEGYKKYFTEKGTDPSKIVVTGMPNYDNLQQFRKNNFPYRDYVMVATTDLRETFRFENRPKFIKKAVKIANGRQLLFKLHPNEDFKRAEKEILKYAPAGTMVYSSGNTNEMIANCCELITQYSTVVYTGIALGKKVHSWFDVDELMSLAPVQNGGTSAKSIADICRNYLERVEDMQQIGKTLIPGEKVEPIYEKRLANNWA
jgi:hypothetical protein